MKKRRQKDALPVRAIVIWTTILCLLLAFFAGLLLFRVKRVEVTGNCHYTDNAVETAIISGPLTANTLFLRLFRHHPSTGDAAFIDSITVDYVDRHTIRVRVSEIKPVCCFEADGLYRYLDENGVICAVSAMPESTEMPDETCDDGQPRDIFIIPLVEGLPLDSEAAYDTGEAVITENRSLFTMLGSISSMINKNGIIPDRLIIGEDGTVTMICGTITVLLGGDEHLEEKLGELGGILESAEGLSGTLHLENFDGSQNRIIFDKAS
ncbi:MAG: hypothetical protein PUA52_04470 [Lachnospiraceae bacterium]|nr:hypothetical protein [Lachnospiraceae bacterium]